MIKVFVINFIGVYQKTLSPDKGLFKGLLPYIGCRFSPSCSDYLCQAIEKFGLIKGAWKGAKRLIRCHPLNDGGYDPV